MPEAAIADLLGQGILGTAVVALSWACLKLQQRVETVQEARVEDAKTVTDTVLEVVQEHNRIGAEWTAAIVELTNQIEKDRESRQ